jgi:hypothetical protein
MRLRLGLLTASIAIAALACAGGAQASPLITQVYPDAAAANKAFVELRFPQSESEFNGYTIQGGIGNDFVTPQFECVSLGSLSGPPLSQQSYLIGDSGVAAGFGQTPDAMCTSNALQSATDAGGWVCLLHGGSQVDCVTWGTAAGCTGFCKDAGEPAAPSGIPAGMSITRRIDRGCPSKLEATDDTDSSAADFVVGVPAPRASGSFTASDNGCTVTPPPPEPDRTPPATKIESTKVSKHGRTATLRFTGSDDRPGALSFECKLDRKAFRACQSPSVYRHLSLGRHLVQVRAIDAAGNVDASPAKAHFGVHPAGNAHPTR